MKELVQPLCCHFFFFSSSLNKTLPYFVICTQLCHIIFGVTMQHIDLKLYLTFIQRVGRKFVNYNFLRLFMDSTWVSYRIWLRALFNSRAQWGHIICWIKILKHNAVYRFKVEYSKLLYAVTYFLMIIHWSNPF